MFRIYYGDGSIYEGDPSEAPRLDVQVVVTTDNAINSLGHLVLHGWDYYLLHEEGWYGVNGEADLVDHLLYSKPRIFLKGRYQPERVFQQILAEANAFAREHGKSGTKPMLENGRKKP